MNFKSASCCLWNLLFSFEYNCIVPYMFQPDLHQYVAYSSVEQVRVNVTSLGVKYNKSVNIFD